MELFYNGRKLVTNVKILDKKSTNIINMLYFYKKGEYLERLNYPRPI